MTKSEFQHRLEALVFEYFEDNGKDLHEAYTLSDDDNAVEFNYDFVQTKL